MTDTPIYETFVELMEAFVLPRLHARPGQKCLDGKRGGGKRAWGRQAQFRFDGDLWNVYADNHYEPLLLAYWSAKCRGDEQTFQRAKTETRVKLELVDDLRAIRKVKAARMYLYRRRSRAAA